MAVAVAAGCAIALSLPPFGWWPLGVLGLAVFAPLLHRRRLGRRAMLGAALGFGQYAVGLWWVTGFNAAGFVALLLMAMASTALAGAIVASRRRLGVLVGLPAALVLTDWVRGHFPFGGLPLGGIPLGQASGPLAPVARLGGPLLVTGVTAAAGAAVALMASSARWRGVHTRDGKRATEAVEGGADARGRWPLAGRRRAAGGARDGANAGGGGWLAGRGRAAGGARDGADARGGHWLTGRQRGALDGDRAPDRPRPWGREFGAAAVVLAAVVALVAAGRLGPDGAGAGPHPTILVAAVQGGGPRGLHAADVDPAVVFHRQLDASASLGPPLDLVVWPEDVIQVDQPIAQTPEGAAVGQLAERLGATVVAGVVENVGVDRFRNAAVAWAPSGQIVARYDKVHRVPFGEYIPGRSLFRHLANLDLVPRDAIAGRGPGLLDTPAGPLGTVISYEVFFQDRARDAIGAGGQLLVVPTNASSYRTSQVPSQEVAAAQLRAWETGRDTIQAAPTGYSALIDHDGRIVARSTLGRAQVITGRLVPRHGRTVFVRFGDIPVVLLALLGLMASVRLASPPR